MLAPQLPLEGALLARGAFVETGRRPVHDLIYVRLRPDGGVKLETILKIGSESVSGTDLSELSWSRLVELITAYGNQDTGYKSRALPFREGDVDGDYDHLARVLEWSAGGGNDGDGE